MSGAFPFQILTAVQACTRGGWQGITLPRGRDGVAGQVRRAPDHPPPRPHQRSSPAFGRP